MNNELEKIKTNSDKGNRRKYVETKKQRKQKQGKKCRQKD